MFVVEFRYEFARKKDAERFEDLVEQAFETVSMGDQDD